jgi:hypothetical protein
MAKVTALVAATALMSGTPVFAQEDNPYGGGTRLTHNPAEIEYAPGNLNQQDRARVTLAQFARCIIKKQRATVMKAVQRAPWAEDANKALFAIADENCLANGELTIPTSLLRGSVYQELYREKYSGGPPTLVPSQVDFAEGMKEPFGNDIAVDVAMRQFGDCVARRDLHNSHALVMASPGSSAETNAITDLLPDFSACLVKGSTWKITKSVMAAILSEVLYREAATGTAAAPEGGTAH